MQISAYVSLSSKLTFCHCRHNLCNHTTTAKQTTGLVLWGGGGGLIFGMIRYLYIAAHYPLSTEGCIYIIRQVTRGEAKSGAVVKHQRKLVVLKTTSNV